MFKATTIAAVKIGNLAAIAGEGQVTFGENTISIDKKYVIDALSDIIKNKDLSKYII